MFNLILAAALSTGAYGVAAPDASAERAVAVGASTRYVHVHNGETVKFTVDGKSFTWHVDAAPGVNEVRLQKIAPQDVAAGDVKLIITPNPIYFGA